MIIQCPYCGSIAVHITMNVGLFYAVPHHEQECRFYPEQHKAPVE